MPNKCYLRLFYNLRFDSSFILEENIDKFKKFVQDSTNYDEKLSENQQVVALLNSLGDKDRKIRNVLEYGRLELNFSITILTLRNGELELKSNFKDTENDEGLTINEK